jgi:hypothetical protein
MPTSHASNNKSFVGNGTGKYPNKPSIGIDKPTKIFKMLWFVPPAWLPKQKTHIMDYCEFKNCEISFNKSDIDNSDLVLFNHAEMNIQPPVKRNNQIWVFSSHESPPHMYKYYTQNQWVPRKDGRLLIGSTMENVGFDRSIGTQVGVDLLAFAVNRFPH